MASKSGHTLKRLAAGVSIGILGATGMGMTAYAAPALDNVQVSLDTPTNVDQCKNNGWKDYVSPSFKNQGDCVSFVATRGKNLPSGN